ncbi:hypothetical protein [Sphaerotilus sp.]|uniref:hypothetical protein n=1 Tax=Sphaerotilus sp. TaxID=2093942 RepID=UPI0034E2F225
MHHEMTVSFGPDREFRVAVESSMRPEDARHWLDEQFIAFDCEPQRASGKVLVADKLLAIAEAAGPKGFSAGDAWTMRFAAAAGAATARATLYIDVAGRTLSF